MTVARQTIALIPEGDERQSCIEDALELVAPQAFMKGLHLTYQLDKMLPNVIVYEIRFSVTDTGIGIE